MKAATKRTSGRRWNLTPAIMGLAITVIAGGVWAVPARAQDRDDHGREVHRDRGHDEHHRYRGGYVTPGYVYAPPPVYYAPPPAPPAIDFIFPLRFR